MLLPDHFTTADELDTALLRGLLGAPTGLAIIAIDRTRTIRQCNETARHLFDLSSREIGGPSILELHEAFGVAPERILRAIASAERDGTFRFAMRVQTCKGRIHLDSQLVPLHDATGAVNGHVLLAHDRTEVVQAEEGQRTLLQAVEQSPASIVITDTRGIIEYANRRFTQVTGYTTDEVVGHRMQFTRSGLTPVETYRDLWRTIHSGREWSGELLNRRKNGDLYWDYVRIMPVVDDEGTITHFVGLQEDISERKNDEEKLRLWATVFENSGEAVMITDHENRILHVNRAFTQISGYAPEEVLGHNPSLLGSGRHDATFFRQMWAELHEHQRWQGEIWDRRKNGEIYPKWLGISAVHDAGNRLTHYVAIFSDISERKAAQDRIEHLAHHDPLTGLPNRLLLADRFGQALAHAERTDTRMAMLILDLDRLKTVNDSLGHTIGDLLLQTLVGRLLDCVRDTDTVSRQGGDEFVMILTRIGNPDAVARVAQKILERVAEPIHIDGHALRASFSIGISLYPDDGKDFETLLRKADTAMYHAKDVGRNTYRFFTEQMNVNALERLLIQNRMRQALEQNQFTLHYQPQIDLADGRVVGVEALARWHHPESGMVPPDRFIPVAEESGLIVALGEWVLREACQQAARWRRAGLPPLKVAVNISAIQFQRGNLIETVMAALTASGLEPDALELELTESILIQNVERHLETVRELKAYGISIAIDDFGTGYSSLSYLRRFAVDKIKIDRSFIRDLSVDPESAAIVRAVIQMARSLQLGTLAEGVETQDQLDFLREAGCSGAQGYLHCRPLPADALAAFLTQDARFARHSGT